MEKRIVDLDIAIRSALHHEEPAMPRSISLISELQQRAIQPLMLKKIPNIVMTLRKVRKYIGPVTPHPDPQVCIEISTTVVKTSSFLDLCAKFDWKKCNVLPLCKKSIAS